MRKFGVIGSPILHSKSPDIHNMLYQQHGIDAKYVRIISANIDNIISIAKDLCIDGINITSPYKSVVPQYFKSENPVVNTLDFTTGEVINTDIYALSDIISKINIDNLVILGGGNSAFSAAVAGKSLNKSVTVLSRFPNNIDSVFRLNNISYQEYSDFIHPEAQCIFISTIPSHSDILFDQLDIRVDDIMIDSQYIASALQTYSKKLKCEYRNGLEWLVSQAIYAFELWFSFKVEKHIKECIYRSVNSNMKQDKNQIVLIGFMGAGKTTIGKEIAKRMNFKFYDIDILIEDKVGMSISEIFEKYGEEYFRKLETEFLMLLTTKTNCIISCGGGIVEKDENHSILSSFEHVIWIYRNLNTYISKIDKDNRPMMKSNPQKLFETRKDKYFSCCNSILDNNSTELEAVDLLTKELKRYYGI
jgi:shikimate kinase/shikimate 5-dehydrogenase